MENKLPLDCPVIVNCLREQRIGSVHVISVGQKIFMLVKKENFTTPVPYLYKGAQIAAHP